LLIYSRKYGQILLGCLFQIASSAIASLLAYVVGIVIASSSVVIARLSDGEHDDTGFEITHEEASWIGIALNTCSFFRTALTYTRWFWWLL